MLKSQSKLIRQETRRHLPWIAFVGLFAAYLSAFGGFFPNPQGGVGHDYSAFLPHLLVGRYWFETNGWFSIPWFIPAWCAGIPLLPDPQSIYFSVPQLLAFVVDPLSAVYWSLLIFSALGYWGFYFLARQCFALSREAAVVSAGVFMFNGFFVYRIIIGHFTFHGFMLFPWLAYFLLLPNAKPAFVSAWLRPLVLGAGAGFIGAYWVYGGMVQLIPPVALCACILACLRFLLGSDVSIPQFCLRALLAFGFMLAGSALKLNASLAFVAEFPRNDYLLPGMQSTWKTLELLFLALFIAPPTIDQQMGPALTNVQWGMGRHEFEFGVSMVPLIALLWWLCSARPLQTLRAAADAEFAYFTRSRLLIFLILLVCLALPVMLNTYSPDWNRFLKGLPIIGSSSQLFRWFVVYIPFMALLTGLIITPLRPFTRLRVTCAALLLIALSNLASEKLLYATEGHRPDPIVNAAKRISIQGREHAVPKVEFVRARLVSEAGQLLTISAAPNEIFIGGESAIACYQPMFGYRLEHFPLGTLKEGPALAQDADGRFNFKNPACYVFPEANACRPGDHFTATQQDALDRLLSYRPYEFAMPWSQHFANTLTGLTLLLWLALGVYGSWAYLYRGARPDRVS